MRTTEADRSELVRLVSDRVEKDLIAPVRATMGPDTPVERTAMQVIRIVADAEAEIANRWVRLQEAVDRTGYSYDTLVHYAKAIHDGEQVAEPWASMEVRREEGQPYEVRVGSLPVKPAKAS